MNTYIADWRLQVNMTWQSSLSWALMPKRLKKDISVTPRHGPSENVQKRKVRKVSTLQRLSLLSLWVCVFYTCIYLLLLIIYLHTEEKSLDQLHKDYYYHFTFAYIILPYKLLHYILTSCLFTWQFRSPAQEFRGKKGDYCLISFSRFKSDMRLPRKGFRYKRKYFQLQVESYRQVSPITGLRTTMRW